MRIRFDYAGTRRSGEMIRFYHASNGKVIVKVQEDGAEHPKSFRMDLMSNLESGPYPQRTDEELLPILKLVAAEWLARKGFDGNPLELLIAAGYTVTPGKAREVVEEAMRAADGLAIAAGVKP